MIEFPCRCGHRFSLEPGLAATSIQCPDCGLLVDVPSLSDLPNIDPDGLYKMDEVRKDAPGTFEEMVRTFRPGIRDEHGIDYDLRLSPEEIRKAGVRPGEGEKDRPKYDPETGQLIRPVEVQPTTPAPVEPPGTPTLGTVRPSLIQPTIPRSILRELIKPVNVAVQLLVVLFCLFWKATGWMFKDVDPRLRPVANGVHDLLALFGIALLIAHYGCTIDETGPGESDDLPRPLRNLSFHDDLWGPLWRSLGAMMICFGPAALLVPQFSLDDRLWPTLLRYLACFILLSGGVVIFPAYLLAIHTTTILSNLSPRRVLNMIRACGVGYGWACVAGMAALATAGFQIFGRAVLPVETGPIARVLTFLESPSGWIPTAILGTFLAHAFVWKLGLLYRLHHDEFDWVMEGRRVKVAPRKPASDPQIAQIPQMGSESASSAKSADK